MRSLPLAAVVLLVAAASAIRPAIIVAQTIQKSLYVSAVNQSGAPVTDLGPSDFVVREDRLAREVLSVAMADEPMQIALLVDNSQAAEPYIRDYRESLTAFITAMTDKSGPRNLVSLITLAERPTIVSDFTSDTAQLLRGAQRIFSMSGSGAYLLEGLIEVSQGITKHHFTRPVIIAISSDGPDLSDRQFESVLTPLKESGAAFHLVVVGRPVSQDHDRAVVFDEGTRQSGGRYDNILLSTALTLKMREVARELKSQYRVTYARPRTLIPPERVTISTPKPGVTVRGTLARDEGDRGRP